MKKPEEYQNAKQPPPLQTPEPAGELKADVEATRALYELLSDVHQAPSNKRPHVSQLASSFLRGLKEYWFLVALVTSGLSVLLYMAVFEVTPWDTHVETRNRRLQVEHHVQVGFDLLERAQYRLSKSEFEKALSLISTNDSAITGRYLSELFLDFESPDWDAAIGMSLHNSLEARFLKNTELRKRRHIIEKYLGDLNAGVQNFAEAEKHYEEALAMKKDYWDALNGYHSIIYSYPEALGIKNEERVKRLVELGESIVNVDSYDYRGLHALGYSLYEQALRESDEERRNEVLNRAGSLSFQAFQLKGNAFTVIMDLGEIARHIDPKVSLEYHKWAGEILNQAKEFQPRDITALVAIKLHKSDVTVILGPQHKKVLVMFYLALDYLAMHRIDGKKRDLALHLKLLTDAKKLDTEKIVLPIYEDQLAVLNTLLNPKS